MSRFAAPLLAVMLCVSAVVLGTAVPVRAADVLPGMLRYPDVSATQIVFVYDNDVWIAPKTGGAAVPLSSPPGAEHFPRFSPDGTKVAFSADYDGNQDIYELPVTGGLPKRLTVQPYGARVVDYAPDGRVVFATTDLATFAETQLWYADPNGGLPERMPLKYGDMASFSADGTWLAFTPWRHIWQDSSWNRYQGGQAADVWSFNLKTKESKQLTNWPGTDDVPMVVGTRVFYLSDMGPEHRRNVWYVDTVSGERKQVTFFADSETRWPAAGPQDIVFQNGGKLWRLPLDTLQPVEVNITLSGDLPDVRPRLVTTDGGYNGVSISPQAKRIAVEKRGDIWTIPAKEGFPVNLTPTDGVAERDPAWSPDGKLLAYVSDETGQYELYTRPADGTGQPTQLTHDSKTRMFSPTWSPDSKRIAILDRTSTYYVIDVASDKVSKIATDPLGSFNNWGIRGNLSLAWSPDSRWLAYVMCEEKSANSVIYLYDMEDGMSHAVTTSAFAYGDPAFDRNGDFLYFTTNQGLSPVYSDVDDYDTYFFANSGKLGYLALRKDVKSPFLPKNDEEEVKSDKPDDKPGDKPADKADKAPAKPGDKAAADKPADKKDDKPKPVVIDFDGILTRGRALPLDAGNYGNLAAGNRKLYYVRYPHTGGGKEQPTLNVFDMEKAEAQDPSKPAEQAIASDVGGYQLTADASKLLLSMNNGALFVVNPEPGVKLEKPVPAQALPKMIDPRHEWRQMIWEDYRLFKEKFYDPHMHGVDWDAARDRALAKLPYAGCTEDVGYIISEMNGEMNVGHSFVNAASSGNGPNANLGLLGCDFERAVDSAGRSGIRIGHVYRGATSELDASGPLDSLGVNVQAGQFLLAINGTPLDPARSPYELLVGKAGATVQLTVSDTATRDKSTRDVLVRTTGSDAELRHRDWTEANRRYVYEHSGGRVGYIHLRDCVGGGAVDLERALIGQHDMDALIIDGRYNSGGYAPRQFVELLARQVRDYITPRYGKSARVPNFVAPGAKVMLINQYAGSSGDEFPFFFRQSGLGKIVGVRTWGGLVGLSGGDRLLDGTSVVVPSLAFYTLDNKWLVEGYGTDPDITVVNDPTSTAAGRDNQLDKAIAVALEEADANPYKVPPPPPYVDRSGVRTTEAEK